MAPFNSKSLTNEASTYFTINMIYKTKQVFSFSCRNASCITGENARDLHEDNN